MELTEFIGVRITEDLKNYLNKKGKAGVVARNILQKHFEEEEKREKLRLYNLNYSKKYYKKNKALINKKAKKKRNKFVD
jgi:hypothetical protein